MSTTLSYFDFEGSRGLECRLALSVAGVPFEDRRLNRAQWTELKPNTPFGAVPVLEHEGRTLAHSNAILRFVGATHGLHPSDPWIAAEHDALMDSVEDLRNKLPGQGLSEEDKKAAREAFAAGWLSQWAETVAGRITGPFLEGPELSVADLKLFVILRACLGDTYDHIPGSFFGRWPALADHQAAVAAHRKVAAYFA